MSLSKEAFFKNIRRDWQPIEMEWDRWCFPENYEDLESFKQMVIKTGMWEKCCTICGRKMNFMWKNKGKRDSRQILSQARLYHNCGKCNKSWAYTTSNVSKKSLYFTLIVSQSYVLYIFRYSGSSSINNTYEQLFN